MKQATIIVMLFLYPCVSWSAIIHVPGDSATIQAGIDGSQTGDTVLVAAGTYTGEGNREIDFNGKSILVKSESGADWTTVDGEDHPGFILQNVEGSAAVLEGFTIRGCSRGIRASSSLLSVIDCDIVDCSGGRDAVGVGMYCSNSTIGIDGCTFSNNIAYGVTTSSGGGIHAIRSTLGIENSAFLENTAANGGGIFAGLSSVTIEDCIFRNNLATFAGSEWSELGGALYLGSCDTSVIRGCLFEDNDALLAGSAIYAVVFSQLSIEQTTFAKNTQCAAVLSGDTCRLLNCVSAFNFIAVCGESLFDVSCCNIYGNVGGNWVGDIAEFADTNGNFSADPLFCDIVGGDFHLKECSPCAPGNNTCGELIGAFGVGCTYLCGDANASGGVDVDDAIRVYHYIFGLLPPPEPLEAGDVDCSGTVDIDDVTYLISYIFSGGNAPCDTDGDRVPGC